MKPKNIEFGKASALGLIRGLEDSKTKWVEFDGWVNRQVDHQSGIIKGSVITALIIEASDLSIQDEADSDKKIKATCKNYQKDTVKQVMALLTDRERDLINKKYASIRALVSMAYNFPSFSNSSEGKKDEGGLDEGKGKEKARRRNELCGIPYEEVAAEFKTFLSELSSEQLDAIRLIVDAEHNARQEKTHLKVV